jgi:hypothetical protein
MKRILLLIGLFAGALCAEPLAAQTIIDSLQTQTNPSDGVIRIVSDSATIALIGKPNAHGHAAYAAGTAERYGFRIQVYMGGNPRLSRAEATARQNAIRTTFPELAAYLLYEAPNWRLLVGDCITREEANIVKQRLQRKFPQFGKEMYIISDKVKIPIER